MKRATHRGECQICGRVQRLPGGNLAHHGYEVRWNSFQGVCPGSKHPAFQVSMDLIPPMIAMVEERIKNQSAFAAELRKMPTEPKSRFSVKDRYLGARYEERDVTIHQDPENRWRFDLTWIGADGKEQRTRFNYAIDSEFLKSPLTVAHWMNLCRASEVDRFIEMDKGWISWQRERCKDWSPKPLLPLEDAA